MKRWAMRGAGTLLLGLLLAHGIAWFLLCQQLQARLDTRLAGWRALGLQISVGPATRGGWPLAAVLDLPAVVVGPGGVPGGVTLRSDRVALGLGLSHPDTLRLDLPAPVVAQAAAGPALQLDAPDARVDVPLADPSLVAFDATNLHLRWPAGPAGGEAVAGVALAHVQAQRVAAGLALSLSAQAIELPPPPPGATLPLGRRLASVSGDATLFGAIDLRRDAAAALAGWRDGGGHVAVTRLGLGYGPLGLSGQGDLRLDAGLQPVAEAQLRVIGWAATLDALAQSGAATARSVAAMKAVLGLLARPSATGTAPEVEVPLAVRDGVASVAGFPLLRLPMLAWRGAQ